jgi:hypothetical protein
MTPKSSWRGARLPGSVCAVRRASRTIALALNFAKKFNHHVGFNVIRIIQTCEQTTSIFETMRAAKAAISN